MTAPTKDSPEKKRSTPRQRILFLDLARGLAVFFMVMQHAMIIYDAGAGEESLLGFTVVLLGTAPAAPVFMLIMGILFAGSQKHSQKHNLKQGIYRGLSLIALGYTLNIFRFCVPALIAKAEGAVLQEGEKLLDLFLAVDILQMAGLSLIVLALVRRWIPWRCVWLGAAAAIAVLSPLAWDLLRASPAADLLWGTGDLVWFPLFPWLLYPLVGLFCGRSFLDGSDTGSLMKKWAASGIVMVVAGGLLWLFVSNRIFVTGDYYRSGPAVHLVCLGFVFMWLPACRWIAERGVPNAAFRLLCLWSKNVTAFYFIQWVVIGWGMLAFGYRESSSLTACLLGVCALGATHTLTRAYLRFTGRG